MDNHNRSDWPKAMYRVPGAEKIEGIDCETRLVNEEDAEKAQADGWCETLAEATGEQGEGRGDENKPTRDELVQKAKELGLTFSPRLGDAKLAALIADAEKAQA